jgi:hypothetical protein
MLKIGWARRSITPEQPVMLHGQMHVRVSQGVDNPVTVTALALERDGEAAIFVGCDVCGIAPELLSETRTRLKELQPAFDVSRLILNATHTHTSLVYVEGTYNLPEGSGAMPPAACRIWLVDRIAEAASEAWDGRTPGSMARGFGHAVIGHNRRVSYLDDTTRMYGPTDTPTFSHIEGYEDHSMHLLYFFDGQRKLTGMVVNLACPSQETEHDMTISADFWHEVREEVARRFGAAVFLLPQCAPAGDQSPHLQLLNKAEEYMRLRRGLTRRQDIARQIVDAIADVYPVVKDSAATDLPLVHRVELLELPGRVITKADYDYALAELQTVLNRDPKVSWAQRRLRTMIAQYEAGGVKPPCTIELHVIRLGDVAFATNPFELYLDYAMRIQARSHAGQTFLVQLANGTGGYLPSQKAVAKHYGGLAADNRVGPEGGQCLVDRSLELIADLWREESTDTPALPRKRPKKTGRISGVQSAR